MEGGKEIVSSGLGCYQNKYAVIGRFSSSDARHKRIALVIGFILAVIVLPFVIEKLRGLIQEGYSPGAVGLILPLYVILWFVHELIHSIPLWWFSKKRPQFGFIYVLLRADSCVSRMEGLMSYLFPFLVVTVAFLGTSIFVAQFINGFLVALALMHLPMCCYDFLDSYRLFRCHGEDIRLAHEKHQEGFDTILFRSQS